MNTHRGGAVESERPENVDPYCFVYRSAWEDGPDTPRKDTIWAESYREPLEHAYSTTDVLVVAVTPSRRRRDLGRP